jgi:hypothetical protein
MHEMQHTRVCPRDLFNEGKLLNGMGFLTLAIHNGSAPEGLTFEEPGENEAFKVVQDQGTGDLLIENVDVKLNGSSIYLYHPYNEKEGTTLRFEYKDEGGEVWEGKVFKKPGVFSEEFLSFCEKVGG